jgi:hypothetical protein
VTFIEYLGSIDWGGAIIAAAVLVAVAAVVGRFLMASTSEVGRMLPGAGRFTSQALLDARGDLPIDSWVCDDCRSVNTPNARHCYSCGGDREELARPLSVNTDLIAAGHNGRRNGP